MLGGLDRYIYIYISFHTVSLLLRHLIMTGHSTLGLASFPAQIAAKYKHLRVNRKSCVVNVGACQKSFRVSAGRDLWVCAQMAETFRVRLEKKIKLLDTARKTLGCTYMHVTWELFMQIWTYDIGLCIMLKGFS